MDCKALKIAGFVAFPHIGGLVGGEIDFKTGNNNFTNIFDAFKVVSRPKTSRDGMRI